MNCKLCHPNKGLPCDLSQCRTLSALHTFHFVMKLFGCGFFRLLDCQKAEAMSSRLTHLCVLGTELCTQQMFKNIAS